MAHSRCWLVRRVVEGLTDGTSWCAAVQVMALHVMALTAAHECRTDCTLLLLLLLSWPWQVLTGETEATEGTVWKHPNLRIAYVAQHAFHHIGTSLA